MNGRPLAGRHRSGRSRRAGAAVCSFVAWVLLVGCGTDSGGDGDRTEPTVEQLLDGVDLGDGWASVAPRQISPFPEAIRPPCPTDPDMPFVDVAEVIESEIENEQRRMGINLTVVSYATKLCFAITSCPKEQPGIERLGKYLKDSYRDLAVALAQDSS